MPQYKNQDRAILSHYNEQQFGFEPIIFDNVGDQNDEGFNF